MADIGNFMHSHCTRKSHEQHCLDGAQEVQNRILIMIMTNQLEVDSPGCAEFLLLHMFDLHDQALLHEKGATLW